MKYAIELAVILVAIVLAPVLARILCLDEAERRIVALIMRLGLSAAAFYEIWLISKTLPLASAVGAGAWWTVWAMAIAAVNIAALVLTSRHRNGGLPAGWHTHKAP